MRSAAFSITEETVIHKRYLTLYNREIRFPPTKTKQAAVHEFDVVGHPQCKFHFTAVFPFSKSNAGEGKVTVLKEFCQGPNAMMYVLPTGGYDPSRHEDFLSCAKSELLEEAGLSGGEWHCLIPDDHPGIAETKWCLNRFTPFLCINAQGGEEQAQRDAEEYIECRQVGLQELKTIMYSGEMLLPSLTTCHMALHRLQDLGYIPSSHLSETGDPHTGHLDP